MKRTNDSKISGDIDEIDVWYRRQIEAMSNLSLHHGVSDTVYTLDFKC